jgi:nucleoside-diphosphate-sugar epimerase
VKVLVTGASGFVAPHLIRALVARGDEVVASARDAERIPEGRGIEPLPLDLAAPLDAVSLPEVDAIVHLAQANVPYPERALELYRVNTVSTLELLAAYARTGARRFVHASSGTVYGAGDQAFRESDPVKHHQLYATSKIHAEDLVARSADVLDGAVSLRLFAPYGPGQVNRMIPGIIGRVRDGRAVSLNDGGRPRMNPIYVDDAVAAIVAALAVDGHLVVNVAGDEIVTIREIAEAAGRALGTAPVFEDGGGAVAGDVVADTSAFRTWLGDRPFVPLDEGVARTAAAVVGV